MKPFAPLFFNKATFGRFGKFENFFELLLCFIPASGTVLVGYEACFPSHGHTVITVLYKYDTSSVFWVSQERKRKNAENAGDGRAVQDTFFPRRAEQSRARHKKRERRAFSLARHA